MRLRVGRGSRCLMGFPDVVEIVDVDEVDIMHGHIIAGRFCNAFAMYVFGV